MFHMFFAFVYVSGYVVLNCMFLREMFWRLEFTLYFCGVGYMLFYN